MKSTRCPLCAGEGLPIVYGYPSEELEAAGERGEVVLGGCVLRGDDPAWACHSCGHRWA